MTQAYLASLTLEQIQDPGTLLPINEILQDSMFYPCAGDDEESLKICLIKSNQLGVFSFIHCDYGIKKSESFKHSETFWGEKYKLVGDRWIDFSDIEFRFRQSDVEKQYKSELCPKGWLPKQPPELIYDDYNQFQTQKNETWAYWRVYEITDGADVDLQLPKRFSILYISGEAIATYQALFWSNKIVSKILAIIQDGTALGGNWYGYQKQLNWIVENHPLKTKPEYILHGGALDCYTISQGIRLENFNRYGFEGYREIAITDNDDDGTYAEFEITPYQTGYYGILGGRTVVFWHKECW